LRQSIERFHQNLKRLLVKQPPAATIAELQHHLDGFTTCYNGVRPHRALNRRTPIQAFNDRPKAFPTRYLIPPHYRVRHDRIDAAGVITLRYNSRLHHIGLSKHLRGTHVTVLIDNRDIRILDRNTGTLIRKLVLDPTRDYQARGVKCGNSPENRRRVARHLGSCASLRSQIRSQAYCRCWAPAASSGQTARRDCWKPGGPALSFEILFECSENNFASFE
jgi:Integrase core domain